MAVALLSAPAGPGGSAAGGAGASLGAAGTGLAMVPGLWSGGVAASGYNSSAATGVRSTFSLSSPPTMSIASAGLLEYNRLVGKKAVLNFNGNDGQQPVLTTAEHKQLLSASDERTIIALLTPRLQAIIIPAAQDSKVPAVLVNCEDYKWLNLTRPLREVHGVQHATDLMPDMFLSFVPFVAFKKGKPGQSQHAASRFGLLSMSSLALQSDNTVLAILEGKKGSLDFEDFDKAMQYCQCFHYPMRCMLFSEQEFWLISSDKGELQQVIKCKWTSGGTETLLKDFFRVDVNACPLAQVLSSALMARELRLCHIVTDDDSQSCHLGSGAAGHVFAATPAAAAAAGGAGASSAAAAAAGALVAIKVCLASSFTPVEFYFRYEFNALDMAAAAGAPVVRPVGGSYEWLPELQGGYYVMSDVGRPSRAATKAFCREALAALRDLHIAGCSHGDARVANLLRVGSKLKWIDMRMSVMSSSSSGPAAAERAQKNDAQILTMSLLKAEGKPLPEKLAICAENYNPSSEDTIKALLDAIWEVLNPKKK